MNIEQHIEKGNSFMTWLQDLFKVEKPIIAMCHLKALPGDPGYNPTLGMEDIVESARKNLRALQAGGVDAIMFSNEASLPYLTKVETITTACMARVIAELLPEISVPFGVNVLWDPAASIDLAGSLCVKYSQVYTPATTACGKPNVARSSGIH